MGWEIFLNNHSTGNVHPNQCKLKNLIWSVTFYGRFPQFCCAIHNSALLIWALFTSSNTSLKLTDWRISWVWLWSQLSELWGRSLLPRSGHLISLFVLLLTAMLSAFYCSMICLSCFQLLNPHYLYYNYVLYCLFVLIPTSLLSLPPAFDCSIICLSYLKILSCLPVVLPISI